MNDMQQRELAIRLAGVAVEILKSKPSSTRRIRITPEQFRKKMVKMGLRPYDDDIIELALTGIEEQIEFFYDEIVNIIRDRSWKNISPVYRR